jgi:type II secretory pathway pseudopilin PulG
MNLSPSQAGGYSFVGKLRKQGRRDPTRLRLTGASGNQGNSLKPLGARWTFYKGTCSQKSGVLPHANFAFSPYMRTFKNMRRSLHGTTAFSLVEVTLALGVAAFCLLVLLGLLPAGVKTQQSSVQQTTANEIVSQISSALRAAVRLPPGLESKVCGDDPTQCDWSQLHGHWSQVPEPQILYFTNDAKEIQLNGTAPATAAFRATLTYRTPPSETTALANVRVSWPAQVDPDQGGVPAGSVLVTMAINR